MLSHLFYHCGTIVVNKNEVYLMTPREMAVQTVS